MMKLWVYLESWFRKCGCFQLSVECNLGFKNYESVFEFKIERDYKHRKGALLTAFNEKFCDKHFFFISPNQDKTITIPLNKLMSVLF